LIQNRNKASEPSARGHLAPKTPKKQNLFDCFPLKPLHTKARRVYITGTLAVCHRLGAPCADKFAEGKRSLPGSAGRSVAPAGRYIGQAPERFCDGCFT